MAVINGIKNLGVSGDIVSLALTSKLESAAEAASTSIEQNADQFNADLDALSGEDFSPQGLQVSNATQIKYNLSGSSSTSLGTLEVKGSNLPVYNAQRDEWSDTSPTITSISYSASGYGSPTLALQGSLSFREYSFQGNSYDLANWTLQRISVGTDDGAFSITGNLKVEEQGPVLRNGQEYWPDTVVSGALTGFEWSVLKSGSEYYRVKLSGQLSTDGFSISSLTLTEDGVSSPLLSASKIAATLDEDGQLVTSNGRALDSSEDILSYLLSGKDSFTGTDDGDTLFAFGGADAVSGGLGDDTLVGGTGKDKLSGGSGSDVFVYEAVNDSSRSGGIDIISDFKSGIDKIDISGIGVFTSFGNKPTSNATGLLWFEKGSLMGSTNADTVAEFSIKLSGVSSLSAADFIF